MNLYINTTRREREETIHKAKSRLRFGNAKQKKVGGQKALRILIITQGTNYCEGNPNS